MGKEATEDQMATVDAYLATRVPTDTRTRTASIEAEKKGKFKRDVDQGRETVIKWIVEKKNGDPDLLERLGKLTEELVGEETNLLIGTNNLCMWLPRGPRSSVDSFYIEAQRGKGPRVRKSIYIDLYTAQGTGNSLDSLIRTDRPFVSERFKTATFRLLAQDIETGLAVLGLNPKLNRLNRYHVRRIAYNPVTVPLLLWLRLNYGYTLDELTG